MKERPILFNGDMVRAVLAGQKTQTRQTVVPPTGSICPYGQPSDRLWVKETFYRYYPSETWPEPKALTGRTGSPFVTKTAKEKNSAGRPPATCPASCPASPLRSPTSVWRGCRISARKMSKRKVSATGPLLRTNSVLPGIYCTGNAALAGP